MVAVNTTVQDNDLIQVAGFDLESWVPGGPLSITLSLFRQHHAQVLTTLLFQGLAVTGPEPRMRQFGLDGRLDDDVLIDVLDE
jgi:hypothetical protein